MEFLFFLTYPNPSIENQETEIRKVVIEICGLYLPAVTAT